MRLICAWCPDCMEEHAKADGDSCPFHFPSQVAPENAKLGFHCEHHHLKLVRPPAVKAKRKPRPTNRKRKKK